jgi:hypothetical protein
MRILLVKSLKRVIPFLLCLALIPSGAWAASYSFETFDVPSASETWGQGINDSVQVTGWYSGRHGFIRSANGSTSTFDNMSPYCNGSGFTYALGINNGGQVCGYCLASTYLRHHGFVRSADGSTYTQIDDPNVVYGSGIDVQGTIVTGINDSGQVTGSYTVGNSDVHGFLTNAAHTQFTTIDYPSVAGATKAFGINNSSQVTGTYHGTDNLWHGFVRSADGSFTPFDVPNAIETSPQGINDSGKVTGIYRSTDRLYHGFVRSTDVPPKYTTIDYPSASITYAYGINNNGQVTGVYNNGNKHGFIATPVVILPVKVMGSPNPYHDTLIEAYWTLTPGSTVTIEAQESPVFQALNLNKAVNLTLLGGYDSDFDDPPTGMTTIQGGLTVTSGSLTVANLVIE